MIKANTDEQILQDLDTFTINVSAALAPIESKYGVTVALAAVANILGRVLAVQDPNAHSKDEYMEVVGRNIEQGNADMIRAIQNASGGVN